VSIHPVAVSRSGPKKVRNLKSVVAGTVIVLLLMWAFASAGVYAAMRQPPESFARIMARVPGPVAFLLLPFETLWTKARAGALNIGDRAPDFSLPTIDKSSRVQLASLLAKQPVVLIFGSYT